MAITISKQILGQEATTASTYCYLYEPMSVVVGEDDLTATKLYIDVELFDTENSASSQRLLVQYAEFDINTGKNITVDLMKIVRQIHEANLYKFAKIQDIATSGYGAIISKYIYQFDFYTDKTASGLGNTILKLPIIGGRKFEDFTPLVDESVQTNEFLIHTNTIPTWNDWPYLDINLQVAGSVDQKPDITVSSLISGNEVCGGYLVWKSRFGGWMHYGFDIMIKNESKRYGGNIEVGMFESTSEIDGEPYIETDYTEIKTSYSLSLKALGLSSDMLKAVSGISSSPAVYWMKDISGSMELMRLTSSSTPNDSKANGGDFSVTLSSISTTSQMVR